MSSKHSRSEPAWIDKRALLLLHEESLAEFGGSRGLRDEGLLDSALARPRQTLTYKPESTISDLAASYGFGLAKNHAFVDGNKRVAFLSIGLFLAINGQQLKADQLHAIETMTALASGDLTKRAWLRGSLPTPFRESRRRESFASVGSGLSSHDPCAKGGPPPIPAIQSATLSACR